MEMVQGRESTHSHTHSLTHSAEDYSNMTDNPGAGDSWPKKNGGRRENKHPAAADATSLRSIKEPAKNDFNKLLDSKYIKNREAIQRNGRTKVSSIGNLV